MFRGFIAPSRTYMRPSLTGLWSVTKPVLDTWRERYAVSTFLIAYQPGSTPKASSEKRTQEVYRLTDATVIWFSNATTQFGTATLGLQRLAAYERDTGAPFDFIMLLRTDLVYGLAMMQLMERTARSQLRRDAVYVLGRERRTARAIAQAGGSVSHMAVDVWHLFSSAIAPRVAAAFGGVQQQHAHFIEALLPLVPLTTGVVTSAMLPNPLYAIARAWRTPTPGRNRHAQARVGLGNHSLSLLARQSFVANPPARALLGLETRPGAPFALPKLGVLGHGWVENVTRSRRKPVANRPIGGTCL
jgi:hypothetical protein